MIDPINRRERSEDGWILRDAIFVITHHWEIILLFILLGALLGWGVSFLQPETYRASRDIYVGLNAYRFADDAYAGSLAGQPFRMVDDYKNWQMEQLNDLVTTDIFLQDTLTELTQHDPYWEEMTPSEFRQRAAVLWRNVGEWHLVVEAPDSKHAVQAVLAWEKTILTRIPEAVDHAQKVVSLDNEMTRLVETRLNLELRQEKLTFINKQLNSIMDELDANESDEIVSSRDYSTIQGLATQAADWQPAWDRLLDQSPMYPSTILETITWAENVVMLIQQELNILPAQIDLLDKQYSSLSDVYQEEAEQSLGLASTLVVEADSVNSVEVYLIRKTEMMILSGACLGLFAWLIWILLRIQSRKHN